MWQSEMMLGEDIWQIDIPLKQHHTQADAEHHAQVGITGAEFAWRDGAAVIVIHQADGSTQVASDAEVRVTEISAEKQAVMGKPLDATDPEQAKLIIDALKTMDPAYVVLAEDMVPSNRPLLDFLTRYGAGYQPDWLGWGAVKIDS